MEIKELKQILRKIPDDYFISLEFNDKKEKKLLEIECLDNIEKEGKVITLRIKFEEAYN
ncbi:MAG TPA: hypothetical protein VMX17_06355 [Candidatus Glassbacteria bacterium]|nr:hypothetical protein [Candidatus Glassbacteria bacterium]